MQLPHPLRLHCEIATDFRDLTFDGIRQFGGWASRPSPWRAGNDLGLRHSIPPHGASVTGEHVDVCPLWNGPQSHPGIDDQLGRGPVESRFSRSLAVARVDVSRRHRASAGLFRPQRVLARVQALDRPQSAVGATRRCLARRSVAVGARGRRAAAEFQELRRHHGAVRNSVLGILARVRVVEGTRLERRSGRATATHTEST